MNTIKNDLSFSILALWGGLALVLVLVGAVWIEAYYHYLEQGERTEKVIEVTITERAEHDAAQRELLETYRWLDRDAGIVGLPIERAMELVAEEMGGDTQ